MVGIPGLSILCSSGEGSSLLGKMAFESFVHVRPGRRFRLTRSFDYTGELSQCWFDGNANATRVM
jgi:hypothetical protein